MLRKHSINVTALVALAVMVLAVAGLLLAGCRGPQDDIAAEVQAAETESSEAVEQAEDDDKGKATEEIGADLFIPLTVDTFEELVVDTDKPVVIIFSSRKCGYCKRAKVMMVEMADEYGDAIAFLIVKKETGHELVMEFRVHNYPTVFVFSRGRQVDKWTGAIKEDEMRKRLDHLLGKRRPTEDAN